MNQSAMLEVKNYFVSLADNAVIRDLHLKISPGELVAVVGSSGAGKSLLAHGILGVLPKGASVSGELYFDGEPLTAKRQAELRGKEIALVPQSLSYLDPLMKTGPQIRMGKRDSESLRKTKEILGRLKLNESVDGMYPFELSGGMTRRTLISTAMMQTPRLVIADEPTPGLDEKLARRVMSHFRDIADSGAAVLLITHDLELAAMTSDRVAVLYAGTVLEDAPAKDFLSEETLRHPYTKGLWRAMPKNGFQITSGKQPHPANLPEGCPFAPRCEHAAGICKKPVFYREINGGYVRCVLGGAV